MVDDKKNSEECPRRSVYKPTDDDWYPSFRLNDAEEGNPPTTKLVKISLLYLAGGTYRVCAWGNDDFGLERDFEDKSEAMGCFLNILAMPKVNQVDLAQMNFIVA